VRAPSYLQHPDALNRKMHIDILNNSDILREREERLQACRRTMKKSRDNTVKYKQVCVDQTHTENLKLHERWKSGAKAKVNVGGSPFNIINMQYNRSPEGDRLRLHDDLMKYRRALRSFNLAVRNHVGLDPISGIQSFEVALPKFTQE